MEHLYNYVFWFNHFEKCWYAIPTTQYVEFFTGADRSQFHSATSIATLIDKLK